VQWRSSPRDAQHQGESPAPAQPEPGQVVAAADPRPGRHASWPPAGRATGGKPSGLEEHLPYRVGGRHHGPGATALGEPDRASGPDPRRRCRRGGRPGGEHPPGRGPAEPVSAQRQHRFHGVADTEGADRITASSGPPVPASNTGAAGGLGRCAVPRKARAVAACCQWPQGPSPRESTADRDAVVGQVGIGQHRQRVSATSSTPGVVRAYRLTEPARTVGAGQPGRKARGQHSRRRAPRPWLGPCRPWSGSRTAAAGSRLRPVSARPARQGAPREAASLVTVVRRRPRRKSMQEQDTRGQGLGPSARTAPRACPMAALSQAPPAAVPRGDGTHVTSNPHRSIATAP